MTGDGEWSVGGEMSSNEADSPGLYDVMCRMCLLGDSLENSQCAWGLREFGNRDGEVDMRAWSCSRIC